ncbi:MAG: hypothetical protein ABIR18_05180 [Chitinophagaceae bacterium]
MKLFIFLSAIFLLTVSARNCNSNKTTAHATNAEPIKYKAKLETKALCMNYTLRLLEGSIDTAMIAANWTDESTGKSYQNVFALGNPCIFPASIEQGQDFYFLIDTSSVQKQCAVCMAYYPTPPKKLFIKVLDK